MFQLLMMNHLCGLEIFPMDIHHNTHNTVCLWKHNYTTGKVWVIGKYFNNQSVHRKYLLLLYLAMLAILSLIVHC